mgnify:FL=1
MKAEEGNPNVEFVVLDYGSEDGLGDWIKANFQHEIDSGRLIYARTEAEHFKMAHAKNMAHRLATGDVLCNVDADNFTGKGFSSWLDGIFTEAPNTLVSPHSVNFKQDIAHKISRRLGYPPTPSGMGGRIAIMRENFYKLGGYNEAFTGWGPEDVDMALRAREYGLHAQKLPRTIWVNPISHTNDERVSEMADADKIKSQKLFAKTKFQKLKTGFARIASSPNPIANEGTDIGCGDVRINFADEKTSIEPLLSFPSEEILPASVIEPATQTPPIGMRSNWVTTAVRGHTPPSSRPKSGQLITDAPSTPTRLTR